ncbi:MAG TPA: hypothetical protein VMR02_08505 [Terracidiphilus sp.]|jgi:hypothetical protein|nr:hypothetical protein [Terracidiphilus sp.]
MRYTKPNVLATVNANAAIQNGTGATHSGGVKNNIKPDNPRGPNPTLMISTTSAYEADE